ncbi:MAG: hypothetical protein KatS3mg083_296 [Candidatus Dojkabacteria bacterium]|nr:MAG: hypothetical protein KatS3mg083_296 [Candidatus Dojkabacteria bacterium]
MIVNRLLFSFSIVLLLAFVLMSIIDCIMFLIRFCSSFSFVFVWRALLLGIVLYSLIEG